MNKLKIWHILILAFSITVLKAQDYSVAYIPDSLKANAHVVIRDENQEITLKSVNSGTEKVIIVMTIFDREGEKSSTLLIPYDKNSTVTVNQIILYDSNGKKIKSVKQSDILDYPAYGSSELFSESRVKYYKPSSPVPYTIVYDYEVDRKNILSLGLWRPFDEYNVSTQHSALVFSYPEKIKINIKEVNIHIKASERHNGINVDKWEVNNLKAIEDEPLDLDVSERLPGVYLMPSVLIYDKYEGKSDNWKEYGSWMYSLYAGRDNLSESEKLKVSSLIKDIPDTLGRIKALYRYIQENTRYVSVTLGIGGYQPFDAATVFENGYGDCKALTNYMFSLLKYSGIRSFPALVASGKYKVPVYRDFPNFHQFDHVILCVPQTKDTIWLECTNQKIAFGFLGDFTDDRDVLLITENGGKFAHTTKYGINENIRSCRSELIIDSAGTATCVINTSYKGLQYDNISGMLNTNYDEQKKWLYSNSSLPSLQITGMAINEVKGLQPEALVKESEVSKNYCSFSGNFMLLPLNAINSQKSISKMLKPRHSDILINRSTADFDTIVYKIPERYTFESIPAVISLNSKFGSYSSSVSANGNEITYIRKFSILEGRYKPSDYKEFYEFILAVSKADNSKIILTKKVG